MSTLKILIIGIFGIIAVMVITAAIHLVAPYVAVLFVIGFVIFCLFGSKDDKNKDE